jgi:hypothetical protein
MSAMCSLTEATTATVLVSEIGEISGRSLVLQNGSPG